MVDEWVQREFVRHDVIPEDEKVHVQRVTEYLSQRACDPISTLQLYRRILRGRVEPDRSSQQHIDLKLSGVVKRDAQGQLVVRNRIYDRIFTDEWAKAAMPAEVPYESLLNVIAATPSGEVDHLVAVFRSVNETIRPRIVHRFTEAKDPDEQVRLATVALHLGDYSPVRTLSALATDPALRTAFILGFRDWHGHLTDLVPVFRDLDVSRQDEADFRSAVCSALGLVPVTDSQPVPAELLEILKTWFREAPDGGTHSAAGWALRQHGFHEEDLLKLAKSAAPDVAGLRDWQVNHLNITMLRIPGGEFVIGRIDDNENPTEKDPSERFEACWMSDREVSIGQFYAVLKDRTRQADMANLQLPVTSVSWYDAVEFCNELSKTDKLAPYYSLASIKRDKDGSITSSEVTEAGGNGFRLPIEKEWEYACRALTTTDYSFGSETSFLGEFAVFGAAAASTCGTKLPNGWGLFDVHGNVSEWCWDKDSSGIPSRVLRGGSFDSRYPRNLRSAFRIHLAPEDRFISDGFRISRTP